MRLNTLFQDGAVLQRDGLIPVWGSGAQPGVLIQAELAGKTVYSRVRANGCFLLRLPPLPAGGPWTLTVSTPSNGDSALVRNVLIGEVWLAGGQSNMEYEIGSEWAPLREPQTRAEVQQVSRNQQQEFMEKIAAVGRFRYFKVQKNASGLPEEDVSGQWLDVAGPDAANISAVAGWFGLQLCLHLRIPVGIVVSAWSGSVAEAWISRTGLKTIPDFENTVSRLDRLYSQPETWPDDGSMIGDIQGVFQRCTRTDPGDSGSGRGWADSDFDDSVWQDMTVPGSWIRQHLAGNGAVWARCEVVIPEAWTGQDLLLQTGGIDKQDITFFNGREVGRTGSGFETRFCDQCRQYRISADLVKPGRNLIAVRAFSFLYDGSLGGSPESWKIFPSDRPEPAIPLAGTWKFHSEFDWGIITLPEKEKIRPRGPGNHNTPGILFDSMIRPLIPFVIRGVIWYQGESNAHTHTDAASYAGKLTALIDDWRYRWSQGDFPFIQTQLADYTVPQNRSWPRLWAVLREQQDRVCRDLPAVYMIPALDIGDKKDIHPQNKKPVGERLAAAALHEVYGFREICCHGPELCGWSVDGSTVKLSFRFADGLFLRNAVYDDFCLAGPDGVFFRPDEVSADGPVLSVRSAHVKNPCQIRYAWKNDPDPVLFNAAGWPAYPFWISLISPPES
ncbi:MAG: hypothetical protein IKO93_08530 [Lentisphaeria bacterium]|nr:hypothetical protein [Lentisphaeria bacterium]